MDFISNLGIGLAAALTPLSLLYCFAGALIGTLIGVLPGIGPTATVAMLLPVTFALAPTHALIMLAGIYYGAQYGGSTTAILINLPGESSSAVTAIDGYQMSCQGRAGPALMVAALGSFFAGTVATLIIAIAAQPLAQVALKFASPEYFSLMVLGLICSVALAHGSVLNALAMICLGLLLGLVGTDVNTGDRRFTFGLEELVDGVSFIPLAAGLFGVAEILRSLEAALRGGATATARPVGRLSLSKTDIRATTGPVLRGTALGALLGILPGGGSVLASFASYSLEKKISRTPERFGTGAIEGVAGPESANNAGAQTSFIPMLTLGIPTNPIMALMVGAMVVHGVTPGPNLATEHPGLFWGVIASMWLGNLMLLVLNLPLVGLWVRLARMPYRLLFPAILAFVWIGVFSVLRSPFDIYMVALFGVLGYLLIRFGCEPAPLLLGFILGPLLEEHFRRAMTISLGDPTVFVQRPISAALLLLAVVALGFIAVPQVSKRRRQVFAEEN